jgi:DtxR family Mn-dependent transcriptional regulator
MGLVEHEPYRGALLTAEGERVALEVIRHHRLLEAYLTEILGMPWDRVHDEAEVLEHYISEELEERIASALGNPDHDPHGDPIPSRDLAVETAAGVPLAELEPGGGGTLARVSDSDPEMLRYLAERRIGIGEEVEMLARQPFEGPCEIRIGGRTHQLPLALASAIRIRRVA